ncbi:DUF4129 domain-containing protein [Saliphagus sp. LR7]|uniref:DUF4129 domain-containing protein n=1 Tax=Saliphagus sp. LR7 TaxID=2282654 RepID=UPI0013008D57|nr:DUF4129 domain-containing protein [Saliphagus sp. LR7]
MSRSRRYAFALAVAALLLVAAAGATAGAPADGVVLQTQNESDNETVRHQDPDEYSEDGDVEELEGWLSGWMNGQLEEGAVELSQGEYDAASGYVDEEYYDRLEQYVDVAGETGGESSEESFREAGERQEEMTDSAREYEETRQEYEDARDEGDEQRARELARELEALAGDVEESSEAVRTQYDEIENGTGADLGEADAAIETANEDVQESQAEIREAEFDETQLSLAIDERAEISFTDPLEVEGEVRTAEGDPIDDEELSFEVGNQTVTTESDGEGAFAFEYRPTTLSLATEELEVAYRPDNESAYLGTSENVSVAVEQVEPTIEGLSVPDRTAYGEEVTVEGEIAVGDVDVENVALAVVADGQRIGWVGVADGEFEGSVELPVSVPAGEVELGVAVPYEGRALAPVTATETVTVAEIPTDLSVSAERTGDGALRVDGSLSSEASGVVGERTIDVAVDGSTVGTATTGDEGAFSQRVEIPESASGNLTVRAEYDGSETSLAPAATTTQLAGGGGGGALSALPGWLRWAGLALAGLLVVGAVVGARRYRRDETAPAGGAAASAASGGEERGERETAARLALSRAAAELEDDPEAAMEHCYAAVRHELAARVGGDRSMTHWEFYRRYSGEDDDLLRDATESYERAVFGREDIPRGEVRGLLERARELSGVEDGSESGDAG